MFEEKYEKLGMVDKENFSRIINQLLAHTFLPADIYDPGEGMTRISKDYLFVERNFLLFQDYFSYAGFSLERDSSYGVIYLTGTYEGNRVRFDKMTTYMVYALRFMYEEEREKLSLSENIIITTGDLIHKLISLGVIRKKPSNIQLHDSLRTIARFRVIEKIDGSWEDAETRILILPVILFIVSNEQISNMYKLIDEEETDQEGADDVSGQEGEYEETE